MSKAPNRREVIKGAIGGVAAGFTAPLAQGGEAAAANKNPIQVENEKPGTSDWIITNSKVDPRTKCRSPWVEGYCSHTSIGAGETLKIMVSTNPASKFTIDIYRLGYYQGKGARLMQSLGSFDGAVQPEPEVGEMRLRECKWAVAAELTIPESFTSGVYLGKLTAETGNLQSYVIFIVRDNRPCDFLFQCSDTTWQAYNRWPDNYALYDNGKNRWYCGPDIKVSFDRPYGKDSQLVDCPHTQGTGSFLLYEYPLAFWLEKEGYDVSYISNLDTHLDGPGLMRAKGFLSVGHDEYWSRPMYDNMLKAVEQGLSAAFLSGDTCWGIIPFLPNSSGVPNRIITRVGQFGPFEEMATKKYPETKLFKETAPTEANLIGARNIFPYTGIADWFCRDENHWIFAGTGMKNGDGITNLVGWEWMGAPADISGLSVVASGMVRDRKFKGEYTATIYPGLKKNWVFNAATIWWSDGLSAPPGYVSPSYLGGVLKGADARVQQITANLLNRFRDRA